MGHTINSDSFHRILSLRLSSCQSQTSILTIDKVLVNYLLFKLLSVKLASGRLPFCRLTEHWLTI